MQLNYLKYIAYISLVLFLCISNGLSYYSGYNSAKAKAELVQVTLLKNINELKYKLSKKQVIVTEKVVKEYITKVEYIKAKDKVIIKEVPKYVTKISDSKCPIPLGFQLHWNKTNSGDYSISPAAGSIDEATGLGRDIDSPTQIRLSDVAEQHAEEISLCKQTEQQLISLQDWVTEQSKLYPGELNE
ncbi:MAG: hypothetical protein KDH96_09510 [Candidatus Riesia sp.]|nr:hypothetical protein [Candidatus Riesia sp.]